MTKELFIKDFINYFGSKNLTERGFEQPFGSITIVGSLVPIGEKTDVQKVKHNIPINSWVCHCYYKKNGEIKHFNKQIFSTFKELLKESIDSF